MVFTNACSKESSFTLVVKEGIGLIVFKLVYSNLSCLKSGLSQLDKIMVGLNLSLNDTGITIAWLTCRCCLISLIVMQAMASLGQFEP